MKKGLATDLVHAGHTPDGPIVAPIDRSANYLQAGASAYTDVRYLRLSNSPRHLALCEKLARIEGAEDALVTSSGMAAISTTLLSLLAAGDHVLVQHGVYGGTETFLADLQRWGIQVDRFDATGGDWSALVRPNTKLVYVESVSNPLLQVPDLPAVVAFCRAHGLLSLIDNTFLSPMQFQPVPFGFDLVLHSASKYLGGHSDLVAGVVAGNAALLATVRHQLSHLGGSLDPEAVYLLDRGLKTLHLRVPHQVASAGRIAAFLSGHPQVERVLYPGLPDDPNHTRARHFDGYGAMVGFVTRGPAERVVQGTTLFANAASLGGVESLVVLPARSSHLGMDPEVRRGLGIVDDLVRVSVGVEDVEDLLADLDRALTSS